MERPKKEMKVGFLHTTPATIGMVEGYLRRFLPGTVPVHFYNGCVKLDNFRSPVGVTPKKNLVRWATSAQELEKEGCAVIVSCCSLMPRATAYAQEAVSVPCVQLDAVMLDRAVETHKRIGIITTTEYVVPYIKEGMEFRAAKIGKEIDLVFSGNTTALALFNSGDYERHDELVLNDVKAMADRNVDCVLMGQIPFALMEGKLAALSLGVPVLVAGIDAFKRIAELLEDNGVDNGREKGGRV